MAQVTINDLTTTDLTGSGVFDHLMRATKAHLEEEYQKNRIKGQEYATVYLGALQAVMDRSLQFLLQQQRVDLEARLLEEQIQTEVKNRELVNQQILKMQSDISLTDQQKANLVSENAQTIAQTDLVKQQKINLEAEALNIPKQGLILDQQLLTATEEVKKMTAETANIKQQTANAVTQNAQIVAQTKLLDQQVLTAIEEVKQTTAQTALINQQAANAVTENTVLVAQECKLRAEFDVLMEQKLKAVNETALLAQKKVTEQAQTSGAAIDANSIIGKQNALYTAQAEGFKRDSEQKVAKIMVDTWNVRRTTDEATQANDVNHLWDSDIGKVIAKMMSGIGA